MGFAFGSSDWLRYAELAREIADNNQRLQAECRAHLLFLFGHYNDRENRVDSYCKGRRMMCDILGPFLLEQDDVWGFTGADTKTTCRQIDAANAEAAERNFIIDPANVDIEVGGEAVGKCVPEFAMLWKKHCNYQRTSNVRIDITNAHSDLQDSQQKLVAELADKWPELTFSAGVRNVVT
jgi:hypothetical protein